MKWWCECAGHTQSASQSINMDRRDLSLYRFQAHNATADAAVKKIL